MIYVFKHPDKEEYIEVSQGINEKHEYFDANGLKWDRVFGGHQISTSTQLDPFSSSQFLEKTKSQRGNLGDLLDRSKELSEKRAEKRDGVDPLRQKVFDDYKKLRHGLDHPADDSKRKKLVKDLKSKGVSVTF